MFGFIDFQNKFLFVFQLVFLDCNFLFPKSGSRNPFFGGSLKFVLHFVISNVRILEALQFSIKKYSFLDFQFSIFGFEDSRFPNLFCGSREYWFSDYRNQKNHKFVGRIFNFSFVKIVWCFPNFQFPTILLLDIGNIAFDLWFIYFPNFRVSKTGSSTFK